MTSDYPIYWMDSRVSRKDENSHWGFRGQICGLLLQTGNTPHRKEERNV